MTSHQAITPEPRREGWSYGYRDFPPCACPDPVCNGRPEAGLRIAPGFTLQPVPAGGVPKAPAEPYRPAVGDLVLDSLNGRLGVVMELDPNRPIAHLRPRNGGCEWETDARWLTAPAREAL
ncbi:hypothetical protein ACWEQL_37115 [Kitasatospora sp. NPDC004240]